MKEWKQGVLGSETKLEIQANYDLLLIIIFKIIYSY